MKGAGRGVGTTRRQKLGELLLLIGVLALIAPPMVHQLNSENAARYAFLKAKGVVADAVVARKWVVEESYTGRGGRPRVRVIHRVQMAYDLNATAPYAQWAAGKVIGPAAYPAPTTADIDVTRLSYDGFTPGEVRPVVFSLGDAGGPMLVEQLEFRTSGPVRLAWIVGLSMIVLLGAALTWLGWRMRFGPQPSAS